MPNAVSVLLMMPWALNFILYFSFRRPVSVVATWPHRQHVGHLCRVAYNRTLVTVIVDVRVMLIRHAPPKHHAARTILFTAVGQSPYLY